MNKDVEQLIAEVLEGGAQGEDARMLADYFKTHPDDLDTYTAISRQGRLLQLLMPGRQGAGTMAGDAHAQRELDLERFTQQVMGQLPAVAEKPIELTPSQRPPEVEAPPVPMPERAPKPKAPPKKKPRARRPAPPPEPAAPRTPIRWGRWLKPALWLGAVAATAVVVWIFVVPAVQKGDLKIPDINLTDMKIPGMGVDPLAEPAKGPAAPPDPPPVKKRKPPEPAPVKVEVKPKPPEPPPKKVEEPVQVKLNPPAPPPKKVRKKPTPRTVARSGAFVPEVPVLPPAGVAMTSSASKEKTKLNRAMDVHDRLNSLRAIAAIAKINNETSAPALASCYRRGLTAIHKLEREMERILRLVKKYEPVLKDRVVIKGDSKKWYVQKREYSLREVQRDILDGVVPAIAAGMLKLNSEEAARGLASVVKSSGGTLARANAAEALGKINVTLSLDTLLAKAGSESSASVKVGLAAGLAWKTSTSEEARIVMLRWLRNDYWQVRLSAAEALSTSGNRDVVLRIIKQLSRESGRMKHELDECLIKLTGVTKHGAYPAWKAWWDENKEAYLEGSYSPRAQDRPNPLGLTTFFGVPLHSTNLVFIIDASPSMSEPADWKPETVDPANPLQGNQSIHIAKYELKKIISQIIEGARFDILVMRHKVQLLSRGMVSASSSSRKTARRFVENLKVEGATNLYGAVRSAMDFTGGAWHKPLKMDSIDTFYLISDGEPTSGLTDRKQLSVRIVDQLRNKKIVVHCIGANARGHGGGILRKIAHGTGGTFVLR